jgi:cysteine desulfurase/selenocysteine lyase
VVPSRADFPALAADPDLVFLDAAAGTFPPAPVCGALEAWYRRDTAPLGRSLYRRSLAATALYDDARARLARFFGAEETETIFTAGASAALALAAETLGAALVRAGARILVGGQEHHSNLLPWRRLAAERGASLVTVPVDDAGRLDLAALERLLPGAALFTVCHVANATGVLNPLAAISRLCQAAGVPWILDAAQSAPHLALDFAALGADAVALSGRKCYGPEGIGLLLLRKDRAAALEPRFGGGGAVAAVDEAGQGWLAPPARFEAGSPHGAGAVGFAAAADWLAAQDRVALAAGGAALRAQAWENLAGIAGLRLVGAPDGINIVSFTLGGVHPHDVAGFLDERGIAVRSGFCCAEPYLRRLGAPGGVVRASLGAWNTASDIERLAAAVRDAAGFFR